MTVNQRIVSFVKGELAKGVHEVPMGSNRGPRVEWYQSHDFLAGGGYPWCVTVWLSACAEAGAPFPYKSPGAYNLYDWCKKHGYVTSSPNVGDGVCFNLGAGHWATFLRFEGNYVVTIDGNVGDRVQECKRPRSVVRGYVNPAKGTPPAKVKVPLWVVTTSVNGHRQVVVTQRSWKRLAPILKRLKKNHPEGFTVTRADKVAKASAN